MRLLAASAALLALSGCRHAPPAAPVSELILATDSKSPHILRGVFPGEGGWRWTGPVFAVSLDRPATPTTYFELDFDLPAELFEKAPAVTITARVNGVEVARTSCTKPGRQVLGGRVPPQALERQPVNVEV